MVMRNKKRNIIFISIVVLFIIGGSLLSLKLHRWENIYGFNEYLPGENIREKAALQNSQAQAQLSAAQVRQFEDFLNRFLKSLHTRAQSYKQQRGILAELVAPSALRSPAYISENQMQMSELTPQLMIGMNSVLQVFETNHDTFRSWARGLSGPNRTQMTQRWITMKDEQMEVFIRYFEMEQQIINLYASLMDHYVRHRDALNADLVNNQMVFADPQAKEYEQEILNNIVELERAQRKLF